MVYVRKSKVSLRCLGRRRIPLHPLPHRALGQGSHTALPICGYFLQSVLKDPAFKEYRAKFDKPKDGDITKDMYMCASYAPKAKVDTTRIDSAAMNENHSR